MNEMNIQSSTSINNLPVSNQIINNNQNNVILNKREVNESNQQQIQQQAQQQIQLQAQQQIQQQAQQQAQQQIQPQMQQQQIQQQQMQQQQMQQQQMQQQDNLYTNKSENYNELIGQLQSATASGMTSLPSRDIPMQTTNISSDEQVKPNFIPEVNMNNYINNNETVENLILENNKIENSANNLEILYKEVQLPLLVTVLYFLFQLPVFKKLIKQLLPALFNNDGNVNLYGNLFYSIFFSSIFYILYKLINQITNYI